MNAMKENMDFQTQPAIRLSKSLCWKTFCGFEIKVKTKYTKSASKKRRKYATDLGGAVPIILRF